MGVGQKFVEWGNWLPCLELVTFVFSNLSQLNLISGLQSLPSVNIIKSEELFFYMADDGSTTYNIFFSFVFFGFCFLLVL